jgi:hypothetical protein
MTNNQENKRGMYSTVLPLLKANTDKTGSVPAFAPAVASFETTLTAINAKEKERNERTTGKMETRDNAEAELIEVLIPVAGALAAYASETNNAELKEKATVRISVLEHMRDLDLLDKAKAISGYAQEQGDKLVPYGVTADVLTTLDQKRSEFETAVAELGKGKVERTGARTALNDLFDAADDILKNKLDNMMKVVRRNEPQLGIAYDAARVIKDVGAGHAAKQPVKAAVHVGAAVPV